MKPESKHPVTDFDLYQTDVQWAKALEIACDIPAKGHRHVDFEVPQESSYLLSAVVTPRGTSLPFPGDPEVELLTLSPKIKYPFAQSANTDDLYALRKAENLVLGIIKNPVAGEWSVKVKSSGDAAFAVHVLAFNGDLLTKAGSDPGAHPVPFKCRACKGVSKGIGAAIVAAAAAAVLPKALLGAVAAYLGGVPAAMAAAFVHSVIGETVDVVSEAACKQIRLC